MEHNVPRWEALPTQDHPRVSRTANVAQSLAPPTLSMQPELGQ